MQPQKGKQINKHLNFLIRGQFIESITEKDILESK